MVNSMQNPDSAYSPAAEALGIGFVHGVKPYLYLERMSPDIASDLGLSENAAEEQADLYVGVPGNRESIFRGIVVKDGVPASDIVQSGWTSRSILRGEERRRTLYIEGFWLPQWSRMNEHEARSRNRAVC
jgi:hypothetical protein